MIALYDGSLEFDSEELDNLTLDWDDVRQVHSARVVQTRFKDQPALTGRIVNGSQGAAIFGFNLRRGNSELVEANTLASACRRTTSSRVVLDYVGNYNLTDDLTVTNNRRVNAGMDWFVTERFFVRPVVVEYFRDPFQNVAHRWTSGAAVGYQLVDTPRVGWEVNGGPAYVHASPPDRAVGRGGRPARRQLLVRLGSRGEAATRILGGDP